MSIADLFGSVAPQYTMTQADRDQSADYESQIKAYEDAYDKYTQDYDVYKTGAENYNQLVKDYNDKLTAYQADANAYNTALDAYKTQAGAYNDKLAAYKKQVEDYNAAVNKFNEGDRLTEFIDTDYYVAAPGEFTAKRPDDFTMVRPGEFEVTKPEFSWTHRTAPGDPGFDQAELDNFIKASQGRARRRGAANAAALNVLGQGGNFTAGAGVQGGAGVSTTPEFSFSATGFADGGAAFPPADNPVRNEGAVGLGYYIPSGLRKFFERPKERDRGPINAPGFENINFLLRGINFPYNIVAGAGGKTREALDSDLPREERIRAGGEAAIETGIQALLPFAGRMAGQPLSRAIVESLIPVSTPKSAAEAAVDTVEDMGRRNMLKGAAATTGIAALAPEVFIEASKKVPAAVTKTAAKAAVINPVNMAAANIKILRQQRDEALEIINDAPTNISELDATTQKIINDAQYTAKSSRFEISDEAAQAMEELDPSAFKTADNDSLEDLASVYFNEDVAFDRIDVNAFDGNMKVLADEIKKRGMDKATDKNGIDQFPFARSFVEDIGETYLDAPATGAIPNPGLKMTDDSGKSTEQLIKELGERAFKSQYEFKKKELEMETDLSPEEIDRIARKNASRSGRNMAQGGVVSFAPYLR